MLAIKELGNGQVALLFDGKYKALAKPLYLKLISEQMMIEGDTESPDKEKTLADVKRNVEKVPVSHPQVTSLTLNVPRTTSGIPDNIAEIKQEVNLLIRELCGVCSVHFGTARLKAYRMLHSKTGFDVQKEKVGKDSLIQTIVENGKGPDLVRVLREYLDK